MNRIYLPFCFIMSTCSLGYA